ncbi:hypothetical protein ACFWWC_23295 [Streptomyces sp. NPDC058642]
MTVTVIVIVSVVVMSVPHDASWLPLPSAAAFRRATAPRMWRIKATDER